MPTPNFVYGKCVPRNGGKKKEKPDFSSFSCGGDSWTRTNDPIDVNDVLSLTGSFLKLPDEGTNHEKQAPQRFDGIIARSG